MKHRYAYNKGRKGPSKITFCNFNKERDTEKLYLEK